MKTRFAIWTLAVSALLLSGCADQDYPDIDYAHLYQNAANASDVGQCVNGDFDINGMIRAVENCDEPANEGSTRQIYAAPFDGNQYTHINRSFEGYYGIIDNKCHRWSKSKVDLETQIYAGDMDYIEVNAKPGTPLVATVSKVPGHKTMPLITLRNSDGVDLVFSGQPNAGVAQVSFLMPGDKAYIAVEELENYVLGNLRTCDGYNFHGGDQYHYLLKIRNATDDMKILVGNLNAGESKTAKGSLPSAGFAQYYSVVVPKDVDVKAVITSMDSIHQPVITPVDTTYNWIYAGSALKETYNIGITSESSDAMENAQNQMEHVFVVSDLDGDFGYPYQVEFSTL